MSRIGVGLGYLIRFSALEVVVGRWKRELLLLLILKKSLPVLPILMFISLLLILSLLILLIGEYWIGFRIALVCLLGFVMLISSTIVMLGHGLSLLQALMSLGLLMGGFLRGAP